jgi:hypothetical protein
MQLRLTDKLAVKALCTKLRWFSFRLDKLER